MTLYDFSIQYLINQTQEELPEFPIDELEYYWTPHLYGWPPYFSVQPGNEQKSDIMKMLAFTLQNRAGLPNIINFERNYAALNAVTNGFNCDTIANYQTDEFLSALQAAAPDTNFSSTSWKNYIEGLKKSAEYLNENFEDFQSFFETITTNSDGVIEDLIGIPGIGRALARNFLKEIGAIQFGKPDIHLYDIFRFDPSVVDAETFDIALRRQADKTGISPYKLDRILWLICSGNYFKHHIKISKRDLREAFIVRLNDAIKNKIVTT